MGLVGGSGEDWATARRGARSALAPSIICGSVISPRTGEHPSAGDLPRVGFRPPPDHLRRQPEEPRPGACRPRRLPSACARGRWHNRPVCIHSRHELVCACLWWLSVMGQIWVLGLWTVTGTTDPFASTSVMSSCVHVTDDPPSWGRYGHWVCGRSVLSVRGSGAV